MSGGFLLLWAFLYYMDEEGLVPLAALACMCHELGHVLSVRLWGGRITAVRLSCVGAELRVSGRRMGERLPWLTTALAGPAVNLLLALAVARLGWGGVRGSVFAGLNLTLGCFNLLPVGGLDGGRALRALLPPRREGAAAALSACLALALWGAGLAMMLRTGNPTLFLTGAWLALTALGGKKPERGEKILAFRRGM